MIDWTENYAIWGCGRCGYVAKVSLPTTYIPQKLHYCKGDIVMISPLNDLAKNVEKSLEEYHARTNK